MKDLSKKLKKFILNNQANLVVALISIVGIIITLLFKFFIYFNLSFNFSFALL